MEVAAAVQALVSNVTNNTDSFADDFNALFGTLFSSTSYMCTNACETCYSGVCGLWDSTRKNSISYRKSNFTTDQILNRQIDATPFVSNYTFLLMNCVQYTSGISSDGQLCFGVDIDNAVDAQSKCASLSTAALPAIHVPSIWQVPTDVTSRTVPTLIHLS
jgi:hypothetical protein